MIHNLVSTAPVRVLKHLSVADYRQYSGMLTSPRNGYPPTRALEVGALWAADNDCFVEYNPHRIKAALERWQQYSSQCCLFFNAPDVVGDATATLKLFEEWQSVITSYGYPVAFTLQNGMEDYEMPWERIQAVFIGGSTEFKFSDYVRSTVAEARDRGCWIHNGRVNSMTRITYSLSIGCNSFDGTNYTRAPWRVGEHLQSQRQRQMSLWSVA